MLEYSLLDPASLPRAGALGKGLKALGKVFAESLPRGSRQRALGKEFFAESHVAGSRQRLFKKSLCREGFAESRAGRLSAKTFFKK